MSIIYLALCCKQPRKDMSRFSINLKIWVCYYLLKPKLYLKFDSLRHLPHSNVWSHAYAYINNLYRVFHYRTIGHLFENILKKFHCIRLNIEGYTAVPASVILLLYKRQQKPPMSNYYQTANMTFSGILKKDTSVFLSCYTQIQFIFL